MTDASEKSSMDLTQQCRKHMCVVDVHCDLQTNIAVIHLEFYDNH
jgi:hypothetical protein